jgi:hypothetical protein
MQPNLPQALDQISQIRRHMVRGQVFRGYRAQTTALTGALAILAAGVQPLIVPEPWHQLPGYLGLWCGLAVFSAAIFAIEQVIRLRRLASPLQNERAAEAAERFIPALAVGTIVTVVFFHSITDQIWMLPGLWAIFFGMGIFASRTLLPRGITFVGGYYLLAGTVDLMKARGAHAFSPWAMGLTFGVGQLLAAAVLYWNLERRERRHHGREQQA